MLSSPSSRRKKATSTTKVAPWSFCAGPKTSPGRLWAIMMWSRTSTACMGTSRIGIADQMEQRAGPPEDPRQRLRQRREGRFLLQQNVEPRVGAEIEGKRQPPAIVPARPPMRRYGADLGCAQGEPPAVEGAAQPDLDRALAVPAELDDAGLEARQRESEIEAGALARGMKDEIAVP